MTGVRTYLHYKRVYWVNNDMKNIFIVLNMIKG
jgi:hypothetical protein